MSVCPSTKGKVWLDDDAVKLSVTGRPTNFSNSGTGVSMLATGAGWGSLRFFFIFLPLSTEWFEIDWNIVLKRY